MIDSKGISDTAEVLFWATRQKTHKLKETVKFTTRYNVYGTLLVPPSEGIPMAWNLDLNCFLSYMISPHTWFYGSNLKKERCVYCGETAEPSYQLPVCRIYGLLPVLKAEQQFHLLDESRQKPWETNNNLVDNLQCSRVVLSIFIVLRLGQTKCHLVVMQYRSQNMDYTFTL